MHFKGKVATVTGGSSGIGKEAARRLVAHGASVVLGGEDEQKLHAAAKEVSEDPSAYRVLAGDIGKPATGAALVDLAEKQFGGLDILINNAGILKPIPSPRLPKSKMMTSSISRSRGKSANGSSLQRAWHSQFCHLP